MQEDKTNCQSIYRNLLRANRGEYATATATATATAFIRELQHTTSCDKFCDFSSIRAAYEKEIGVDSMKRIESFDELEKDTRRAEQAVVHFFDSTQSKLVSALDWPGWLWYHTYTQKVERVTSAFPTRGWGFVRADYTQTEGAFKLAQQLLKESDEHY